MTTYRVSSVRSGEWWAFSVPAIPGAYGQARRLDHVAREARDVIALMLELDEGDAAKLDIELDIELDGPLQVVVGKARAARQRLDASQREAQESIRLAASELHERGLSMRDIGSVLGLSFQRVHQILGGDRRAAS